MYKITRQERANSAAKRWLIHRSRTEDMLEKEHTTLIYKKLLGLGEIPNPDGVDNIMGNTSWTRLRCGRCNRYVEAIMSSTAEYSEVSNSVRCCLDCIVLETMSTINKFGGLK